MIVSIVTFRLPKRWTVEEAAAAFKYSAPKVSANAEPRVKTLLRHRK
jgi:hypothetical protein